MSRIIDNYMLYEVIGEGSYGKVYRAINKLDNKQYAMKVIEVKKFEKNKKLEECTVHQINILSNIEKNQHIISYFDMLKTKNNFYFVYEYCNGGTLEGILRKYQNLPEKKALLILKQLLQAFQILNKNNIMHRDLKPDNIFFHNNVLKVGDFGFCKSLEKAEMTKTMLGSPIYMAPQILNGQIYSNKADIWSIGVVLYEMLYGYCPFQSSSIPKLIEVLKETELDFPTDIQVSNQTKSLLKRILTKNPQKRIQWMELFQLKISNEGKFIEQNPGKLSFVFDEKDISKTMREVKEINQFSQPNVDLGNTFSSSNSINTSSSSSSGSKNYLSYNTYSSPKNGISSQSSNEREKMNFGKKNHVEEVNSVISSVKKPKGGNNYLQQLILKSHQEVVKGINIVRSMGLNNQKSTPLFSLYIFKAICERLRRIRDQQLLNVQTAELKQGRQIIDQQIYEMEIEVNLVKTKVQKYQDWKKAVKAKLDQFRNIKLCYELVMFLNGEASKQKITLTQMNSEIRTKIM